MCLRDDVELGVFSLKLATHPVYSKSIIDHLDAPTHTTYYDNGQIYTQYWIKDEYMHRCEDLPANIIYYENGQIQTQEWRKNGRLHRENNKPAYIKYRESKEHIQSILDVEVWYKNGKINSESDKIPYYIEYYYNGGELSYTQEWRKGGMIKKVNFECFIGFSIDYSIV